MLADSALHSESRKAYLDLAHIYEGAVRRAGEREAKSEARRAAMRSAPEASVPGAIRSRGGSTASLALRSIPAFGVVLRRKAVGRATALPQRGRLQPVLTFE